MPEPSDADLPQAGMPQAGMPQAGMPQAGMPQAGMPQAGMPQAGMPEAEKPEVDFPEGDAPSDLVVEDITVGEGSEAVAGQSVTVHYVGVAFSTGEEFDSSWNRGEPFVFPLGRGRVIAGWDQGVAGMKVGGRRRLTIPSRLGYGERGAGAAIAPGETLIFVVDLLGVR